MLPDILIYEGYIDNNAVLLQTLQKHYGRVRIGHCDADDIINGALTPDIHLFIMPGGADLYYCEKLNGAGNAAIKQYVEGGGNYLGICGGAYYACQEIEWAKDTDHEICGERKLAFYNGSAIGPVYNELEDQDINKSWKSAINIQLLTGKTGKLYYYGGPVFSEPNNKNTQILARYTDIPHAPAAIIEIKAGQGHAILSSPHIEYTGTDILRTLYKHRNLSYEREFLAAEELKVYDTFQNQTLSFILNRFPHNKERST